MQPVEVHQWKGLENDPMPDVTAESCLDKL